MAGPFPALHTPLEFALTPNHSLIMERSVASPIPAGKPFARSGNSGTRTTGPHVHMEAFGPNATREQIAYGGDRDPSPYVDVIMFTKKPPQGFTAPAVTTEKLPSARISAQPQKRQQLPSQLIRERRGPQVVLIDDTPPPIPQIPSAPSSGMMLPMITGDPLNSFIKNKLLLDLAYT